MNFGLKKKLRAIQLLMLLGERDEKQPDVGLSVSELSFDLNWPFEERTKMVEYLRSHDFIECAGDRYRLTPKGKARCRLIKWSRKTGTGIVIATMAGIILLLLAIAFGVGRAPAKDLSLRRETQEELENATDSLISIQGRMQELERKIAAGKQLSSK